MEDPAPATWDGVLVRFGEIGIKSPPVRRNMTNRLRQNLLDRMVSEGVQGDVLPAGSRLWMVGPDAEALTGVARRTFGVVSVSLACRVPATIAAMGDKAAQLGMARPWTSFAVRATREGTHPFRSQDIAVQAGSIVWKAAEAAGRAVRVDLTSPELQIFIEARGGEAFVYTDKLPGPGGLPLGSQGTVVALLCDAPSFVAAWLVMRRGCRVVPLHAGTTGSLPTDAVDRLARWGLPRDVVVLPVCTGTVSKPVLLAAAAALAQERHADAIVTGDTLASQLMAPAGTPVLRPVCGLDPAEVRKVATAVGLDVLEYPDPILDPQSRETVESLRSMRRVVSA